MKLIIADDSSMMRERIKNQVKDFDQVTIVGEAGNRTKCLALGADNFLSKSDDFEKINFVITPILLLIANIL
jgi:DNA-binding NarL/FixJ family response regulator